MSNPYDDLIATDGSGTPVNFTDLGAGSGVASDSIVKDINGIYNITYAFVLSTADIAALSYGSSSTYYAQNSAEWNSFPPNGQGFSFIQSIYASLSTQANFTTLTNSQKTAEETILKDPDIQTDPYSSYFGDVANVSFGRPTTNDVAAITIGANTAANTNLFPVNPNDPNDDSSGFTFRLYQGTSQPNTGSYGDIWLNSGYVAPTGVSFSWNNVTPGTYAFLIELHELGHALGLQHPNVNPSTGIDSEQYTVMSTNVLPNMSVYASGLQLDDIAAIQSIYGANYSIRSTDTIYGVGHGFGSSNSAEFIYTIWDGGGTNLIDATGYGYTAGNGAYIDLRQGAFSSIGPADSGTAQNNVAIAFGALIQNAIGTDSGNDALIGNAWDNVLYGAAGIDTIYADGKAKDATVGVDWNASMGSQWNNSNDLSLHTGSSVHDVLLGGTGNDTLYVGIGSDVLHGGYKASDITGAQPGWDPSGQFTGINNVAGTAVLDITYATDGIDTANYSRLYLSSADGTQSISAGTHGIDVTFNSTTSAAIVEKGTLDSSGVGSDGTDHLFSIEAVVGTAGDDRFFGANGLVLAYTGADTALHYYGGGGNDRYKFDLAIDYGYVAVDDSSGATDRVVVVNGSSPDPAFAYSSQSLGTADTYIQLAFLTSALGPTAPSIFLNKTQIDIGTNVDYVQLDDKIFEAKQFLDTLITLDQLHTHTVSEMAGLIPYATETGTSVTSGISWVLDPISVSLSLTGSLNINATGNPLMNILTGNAGNNTLDGGAGADTMSGGAGNDTYVVDDAGDSVSESTGGGTDTIVSSISFTLGNYFENLTLTGTADVNGTGNAADNVMTGNSGNNTLDGGSGNNILDGGAGADSMIGGSGNDTYVIDNAGDVIIDSGGTNAVQSSIAYTLTSGFSSLTLTGTAAINGTGDGSDNSLVGNSGNNTLDGGSGNNLLDGGAGVDTMIGGSGNDTYVVDNSGDTIIDAGGTDTVQSYIDYSLVSGLENLTLIGSGNINGTGTSAVNVITGNSGSNTFSGGAGSDTYVLGNGGGQDVVTDGSGSSIRFILTQLSRSPPSFIYKTATTLSSITGRRAIPSP